MIESLGFRQTPNRNNLPVQISELIKKQVGLKEPGGPKTPVQAVPAPFVIHNECPVVRVVARPFTVHVSPSSNPFDENRSVMLILADVLARGKTGINHLMYRDLIKEIEEEYQNYVYKKIIDKFGVHYTNEIIRCRSVRVVWDFGGGDGRKKDKHQPSETVIDSANVKAALALAMKGSPQTYLVAEIEETQEFKGGEDGDNEDGDSDATLQDEGMDSDRSLEDEDEDQSSEYEDEIEVEISVKTKGDVKMEVSED
ncbi:MAG: hypothetical protein M1831_006103 [Alyxoria varia]|nr:MAG: hypothetical protein M1831_006103 [Alyxoria varia]